MTEGDPEELIELIEHSMGVGTGFNTENYNMWTLKVDEDTLEDVRALTYLDYDELKKSGGSEMIERALEGLENADREFVPDYKVRSSLPDVRSYNPEELEYDFRSGRF